MLDKLILLAAALAAAPLTPPPATPPGSPEFRAEAEKVVDLDVWPAAAARAALEGIEAMGMPDYFDDEKLLWNGSDGALRTEVRNRAKAPVVQVVETGKAPAETGVPGVRYDEQRGETMYEGKSLSEVRAKRGLKLGPP